MTTGRSPIFFQWLIFLGVLLFVMYLVWESGLFRVLWEADRSHISQVILAALALGTFHAGYCARNMSWETDEARRIRTGLATGAEAAHDTLARAPDERGSLVARHLDALRTSANCLAVREGVEQASLVQVLERRVRASYDFGWFLADLMLKLGILGTVVGFIFMLSSVATLEHFDVATMQTLLTRMSSGMGVALYTTLCGLVAGIILGFQYQLLDRGANHLVSEVTELAEVYYLPALRVRATDSISGQNEKPES